MEGQPVARVTEGNLAEVSGVVKGLIMFGCRWAGSSRAILLFAQSLARDLLYLLSVAPGRPYASGHPVSDIGRPKVDEVFPRLGLFLSIRRPLLVFGVRYRVAGANHRPAFFPVTFGTRAASFRFERHSKMNVKSGEKTKSADRKPV
jgi:hypothetical protein